MDENYNLAERYRIVRKHLDRLGYRQALSLDALPLIERLLADLIQTTDSLKHFKIVAQDNIEACSQLQLVTEPYKCDNAKLVQECNQLHMKLLDTNESHQKQIKELKKQVRKLDIASNDVQLISAQYLKKIKELEAESAGKSAKILELQGKCCKPVISSSHLATKKRACYPLRRPTLEADPLPRTGSSSSALPSSRNVDPHVLDLLEMADHRMNCLNREVTKLKGDLSSQSDSIHTLKSQLAKKEKEIMRLKEMLDGGRPLSAVTKDCFCKKMDKSHCGDVGDVKILERAKQDLEERLKDSMEKQHEAMSRALKLAERNEKLEKELRDIDHIALAVEADCNSAVQENNKRVCRLQEKVEDLMTQVHVLESELTVERREARDLRADLETCKLEKRNIQRVLESTLDEKKQMNDKMNQLTVIEKDLNNTVERLTKSCARQRQEIAQLESSEIILRDQVHTGGESGRGGGDDREKNKEKGEKNDKNKGKKTLKTRIATKVRHASPLMNKHSLNGHGENEVSKDVSNNVQAGKQTVENQRPEKERDSTNDYLKKTIERLETERDYYRNEYNKFREEFNLFSNGDNADLWTQACELRRQLNEKEQAVAELQRERKALDREKFNLQARLQTSKNQQRRPCITCSPCSVSRPNGPCNFSTASPPSDQDSGSTKAMLERLEQERDTARADVDRLAEERNALRERLKIAADAHTSEQRRLRENLLEAETRLKQLETERQDLMLSQGTRRATINGLEDQLEDLRSELRRTKEELTTQRTQYFQLRALQEQTDQALGDVQGQLGQSETELNKMMDHRRNVEQRQMQLDNQVKELKEECNMLRANLTQLDQEKDQLLMNLDEKTERIAELERDVRSKEQQSSALEQQVLDFQHKYETCVEQSTEQERQMRTMDVEITNLQRQLQSAFMDRENAIRENSRIQDDLAAVTCECRNLQRELEISRAESYDLKRQLQTYVTEVRRAEELLNRKENERSEMLNHFRSLSLEATVLETNNQSLESEAAEARGALQTAQDRLLDLERQIADRDCLIRGYETQIAELTQNIASMETQLHQQGEQRKRAEADLNAVRDLCVKLDQQKESLEAQLGEKEAIRLQYESQLSRLKADQNMVQDQMSRDNAAVDRLEAMLSQARQESMTNQAINQELQSEMTRLKQKIGDLQNKLHTETSELRRYQNQAAEYSKQIGELRRQMTNERFDRARKEEETRRSNSPHGSVKQTCPPCITLEGSAFALRPDPKSINQWKSPAPSHRIPEESRQRGCSRPDLKKEAQRTNRFNTNSCHDPASTSLTTCRQFESNSGVSNDYQVQDQKNIPCINIIMKPRLDSIIEPKDESIQIVEIAAIADNITTHSIHDTYSLPSASDRNQLRRSRAGAEKKEKEIVDVQNGSEKRVWDVSVQTAETQVDRENIGTFVISNTFLESTSQNVTAIPTIANADNNKTNRGVEQFKDNRAITRIVNIPTGYTETINPLVEYIEPIKSLLVNSMQDLSKLSDGKSCVKNPMQQMEVKFSEGIQREIKVLEGGSCVATESISNCETFQNSIETHAKLLSCKDMASHAKVLQNYPIQNDTAVVNSYIAQKETSTLPSLLSNDPTISKISVESTDCESVECISPLKNRSFEVTAGAMTSDSRLSTIPDNTSCWLNQISCRQSDAISETDDSASVSFQRQYFEHDVTSACGNSVEEPCLITNNLEKFDVRKDATEFQVDKKIGLSKSETNSSAIAKLTDHLHESEIGSLSLIDNCISNYDQKIDDTFNPVPCGQSTQIKRNLVGFSEISTTPTSHLIDSQRISAAPNTIHENKPDNKTPLLETRNTMTASDLTRPEFMRMLTEIREHTCGLETQLSAMNEAIRRKREAGSNVFSSTLKSIEPTKQGHTISKVQVERVRTCNKSACSSRTV